MHFSTSFTLQKLQKVCMSNAPGLASGAEPALHTYNQCTFIQQGAVVYLALTPVSVAVKTLMCVALASDSTAASSTVARQRPGVIAARSYARNMDRIALLSIAFTTLFVFCTPS